MSEHQHFSHFRRDAKEFPGALVRVSVEARLAAFNVAGEVDEERELGDAFGRSREVVVVRAEVFARGVSIDAERGVEPRGDAAAHGAHRGDDRLTESGIVPEGVGESRILEVGSAVVAIRLTEPRPAAGGVVVPARVSGVDERRAL